MKTDPHLFRSNLEQNRKPVAGIQRSGFKVEVVVDESDIPKARMPLPYRDLAAAIIEQAGKDLHDRKLVVRREALNWLDSADIMNTYSFLNVCDILELDPGSLRRRLLSTNKRIKMRKRDKHNRRTG